MACKYYGNCKHQSGWCRSDSMLIKCTYGLNNLCSEQIQKIVKLEEENKKLKRLLRLAVEEPEPAICNYCKYENEEQCEKERRLLGIENDACAFVCWQHADEAMKLIGGDK